MHSLRELQRAFAAGVYDETAEPPLHRMRADGIPASERFSVYRNNVHVSLADALAAVYPVVEKLVGALFFRQTARQYLRVHPSATGNLHDFGGEFAAFLGGMRSLRDYPYVPDVARLEWAWHRVYHAADTRAAVDLVRLGHVTENDWQRLRFRLHPATALVASRFPVLHIWQANQDGVEDDRVSLDEGGVQLLVARPHLDVEIRPLSVGEYALLHAFEAGRALERAHEQAELVEPGFDLAGALSMFIQQRVLTGFAPDTAPIHFPPEPADVDFH